MSKLQYNEISEIPRTVERVRKASIYRKDQLKQIAFMIKDHEQEWLDALKSDARQLGDIIPTIADVKHVLKHLDSWAKPSGIPFNLIWFGAKPRVYKEPKGVVLIIAPFNYPLQLALTPLIGAISGGNAAVIKPSEQTPATAALLAKYIPQYLDPELYAVVNGAIDETTALLKQKFDHIFYTGSTTVGRIIGKAAAEHLTPVTLELGGKSPVVILDDTDVYKTARRILWAKSLNAGQTCIAPDYLLVAPSIKSKLIQAFKDVAQKEFYKTGSALTGDLHCKYVTPTHFARGKKLLESSKGKIVHGGQIDEAQNKIEVTLVDLQSNRDDSLMESEIFGALLPMIDCATADEAIRIINSAPHPLALYVFTKSDKKAEYIRERTRSGQFVVNDLIIQYTVPGLPFGGVGDSGHGSAHGKKWFDTFVHERASLNVPFYFEPFLAARYPPSSKSKISQMKLVAGATSLGFSRPSNRPQSTVGRLVAGLRANGLRLFVVFAVLAYLRQRSKL